MDGKEKETKHKVKRGLMLWMFPGQAKEQSAKDLIRVTFKMIDTLETEGKKEKDDK